MEEKIISVLEEYRQCNFDYIKINDDQTLNIIYKLFINK